MIIVWIPRTVASFARRYIYAKRLGPGVRTQYAEALRITPVDYHLEAVIVRAERAEGIVDLAELGKSPARLGVANRRSARNVNRIIRFCRREKVRGGTPDIVQFDNRAQPKRLLEGQAPLIVALRFEWSAPGGFVCSGNKVGCLEVSADGARKRTHP